MAEAQTEASQTTGGDVRPYSDEELAAALLRAWWPVARLADLHGPHEASVLGHHLVVYRGASGQAYVLDGHCPHRGASLTLGEVADETVACPYHGWQWDGGNGRCVRIPALGKDQSRIPKAAVTRAYPVVERFGLVWTCLAEDPIADVPDPDELEGIEWAMATATAEQQTNVMFSIENFRDVAHFPFVHHESLGVTEEVVDALEAHGEGFEAIGPRNDPAQELAVGRHGPREELAHAFAPNMTLFTVQSTESPQTRQVVLHCPCPLSLDRTRVFRVVFLSRDQEQHLESMMRQEDQVYAEDGRIQATVVPKSVPGSPPDQVHTLADAFTLRYRRAFYNFIAAASDRP